MKTPKELAAEEKGETINKQVIDIAIDEVVNNAIKENRFTSKGGTLVCGAKELYRSTKETQYYFLQCGWYASITENAGNYEINAVPFE